MGVVLRANRATPRSHLQGRSASDRANVDRHHQRLVEDGLSSRRVASKFDAAWAAVEPIEGWLTRGQALALFRAASTVRPGGTIVEIGSHRGRSTVLLAKAKDPTVRLLTIDPFADSRWGGGSEGEEAFLTNVRTHGVNDAVTFHRGTSRTASAEWPELAVDFLYVDGAHDRNSVLSDFDAWSARLRTGSRVYFHDAFSSPGVTAAVLQRLLWRSAFAYAGSCGSLVMFVSADPSFATAGRSAVRLVMRLPYFARNLAVKIALRRSWSRVPPLLGHRSPEYPY
jgi:predicted O-methyltransferase YrrM